MLSNTNILYITPWFPESSDDSTGLFIQEAIIALSTMNLNIFVLHTKSWRFNQTKHHAQQNPRIITARYLSIPRCYLRSVSNWSYIIRFYFLVKKLVRRHNISLIHAHTEVCGLVAVYVGKLLNIPSIVTVHGIETNKRFTRGYAGKMLDTVMNRASRVIFVGEPLNTYYLQRGLNLKHRRIVSNGFKLYPELIHLDKQPWSKKLKFISVSHLQEGKGVELTIKALSMIENKKLGDWEYLIVGDGPYGVYLQDLVNNLQLTDKVKFAGFCAHSMVMKLLRQADIFCLPSYREAFGIAYLEAMAYGLLTIGVAGQGPSAFIENGETGFLIQPRDVTAIANIFEKVFLNPVEMQKIAAKGRQYVLEHCTWQKNAEVLLKVYQELLF